MGALEQIAYILPGAAGLVFYDSDEHESHLAEQHMGSEAFILTVVGRTKNQRLLQRAEGGFDLQKLLVTESNILREERIVRSMDLILPSKMLHGLDSLIVDAKLAAHVHFQIALVQGGMTVKTTVGFGMGLSVQLFQVVQCSCRSFKCFSPLGRIPLGFFRMQRLRASPSSIATYLTYELSRTVLKRPG